MKGTLFVGRLRAVALSRNSQARFASVQPAPRKRDRTAPQNRTEFKPSSPSESMPTSIPAAFSALAELALRHEVRGMSALAVLAFRFKFGAVGAGF